MRLTKILLGVFILAGLFYLFLSFRFSDQEFVQIEVRYVAGANTFSDRDVVTVFYESRLPIPFFNAHWREGFIFPTFRSEMIEKKIPLKDFLKNTSAASVTIESPMKIAGLGDHQLLAIEITSVGGQQTFASPRLEDPTPANQDHSYFLFQSVTMPPLANAAQVLFRILSPNVRFQNAPEIDKYFVTKSGELIQNPFFKNEARVELASADSAEKKVVPKSILPQMKSRPFKTSKGQNITLADLYKMVSAKLDVVRLHGASQSGDEDNSLHFVFKDQKLLHFVRTTSIPSGGVETKIFYFENEILVYSANPIWSSLYRFADPTYSNEARPSQAELDGIQHDADFLKTVLYPH